MAYRSSLTSGYQSNFYAHNERGSGFSLVWLVSFLTLLVGVGSTYLVMHWHEQRAVDQATTAAETFQKTKIADLEAQLATLSAQPATSPTPTPPSSSLRQQPATQLYKNDQFGYQLTLPSSWKIDQTHPEFVRAVSPDDNSWQVGLTADKVTLDQAVSKYDVPSSTDKTGKSKLVAKEPKTLAGLPAYKLTLADSGPPTEVWLVEKSGTTYGILKGYADATSFAAVVQSFSLE